LLQDTSIVDHEPAPIVRGDLTLDGTATSVDLSSVPGASSVDPFALVASDLATVSTNVQGQLAVDHPVLQTVAEYFFTHDGGKKFRPAMVLLVARAVAELPPGEMLFVQAQAAADLLAGSGLTIPGYRTRALTPHRDAAEVAESQMRLAEITEMIHTASLLHDDVIDDADTRRGMPAVNSVFGNKLAILAGDFLLARASISLARLRDVPVIETMSTIIEHLVKGEVLQMRPQTRDDAQMTQFEVRDTTADTSMGSVD
jgi:geranylgeranyl pyrophosphate synthase